MNKKNAIDPMDNNNFANFSVNLPVNTGTLNSRSVIPESLIKYFFINGN